MTTRIFLASTLYGAATLAAALDAGCFEPASRSILLVSNNAANPEATPGLDEMSGFERLRDRFDDVLSWNEAVHPFHPGAWSPRPDDVVLWERYLRLLWNLGDDPVHLVAESIQVVPALAVTDIFTGAPIDIYADGLMSYGPTRNRITPLIGTRIARVLHLDLVPGLRPMLLREFGSEPTVVPTEVFLKVLADIGAAAPDLPGVPGAPGLPDAPAAGDEGPATDRPALLLGQYLSALSILTADEEEDLHLRMLRGAHGLGHRRVFFKPHPTAPARFSRRLEEESERLGVELTVVDAPVVAEVLYQRLRPGLVVGCFSTALFTAASFYGLRVARVGTELLLDRLVPYENSNRVPVTICHELLPEVGDHAAVEAQRLDPAAAGLQGLLTAVGFAMQPKVNPDLRDPAVEYLGAHQNAHTLRYFKRRRLTVLDLPGGVPARMAFIPRNARVRGVVRRVRSLKKLAAAARD
ncbi:alpha-2,8-polysialyltransferase family protein [Streptomyces fuscigenes]|uniref:alpha-2,8-polysialyltransferase family protein n=1 Tax=Streptomyces fuscigenes TaxID=1528880 RepID=UPI001F21D86D|nr:alpha-2,8-polysialyltransferase family protein [Streptomyces fuscigenes]MCF3961187.1 alpha-2,8-polysialyltransferase family protein [Streptomyces fuscigenes]